MTDPLAKLKRHNRRQMSDVAQKMVAMCLHDLSARLVKDFPRLRVADDEYVELVGATFGRQCAFCTTELADDRSAHVEHLDAMNRWRGGLHVAGNVVLACQACNYAKRRDDALVKLTLGRSGWDSFLGHVGTCGDHCGNCAFWDKRLPETRGRRRQLEEALARISQLRQRYDADSFTIVGPALAATLEDEYRKLQTTATSVARGWVENHYHIVRQQVRDTL